jgi:hypothetical protein
MKGELPAQLDKARLDPNDDLNKLLCELVARCWLSEAMHRPTCLTIIKVLEGASILRQSGGPCLESFTSRNSYISSRARLSTPASPKLKHARILLEGLYTGQFKFYSLVYNKFTLKYKI